MSDFPFAIVGFDLDGTFIDTAADLAAAVNAALATIDRPALSVDAVRPMIGGGARQMLTHGMAASGGSTPEQIDALHPILLDYYRAHIAVASRPFPGAVAVLGALDALGVKTAIVTNKVEALARTLLTDLGLIDRFATVIGGDTMGPGRAKPAADPIIEMIARLGGGRAAFVGDSMFDIAAARNAGIPSVAVSFGFLMQPVEELGADAIIDDYADLIPTLARL